MSTVEQIDRDATDNLVSRFLSWPLPDSVCSDPCATERGYPNRCGTNLLTADEARQMIRHVLAGELDYRTYCRIDPDQRPDGTVESLSTSATMLEAYGAECFPANEKGQVHFARGMMDSAAAEIRAFLATRDAEMERAWRDGFQCARSCLLDDEAACLTEGVEQDAWADSATALNRTGGE